jgi:hypothetical protein
LFSLECYLADLTAARPIARPARSAGQRMDKRPKIRCDLKRYLLISLL